MVATNGRADGIARPWSIFMTDQPLLLSPTWTQLPFEHGFDTASSAGTAATKELMRPSFLPICWGCRRYENWHQLDERAIQDFSSCFKFADWGADHRPPAARRPVP
jgi:hypothetical protein